MSHFNPPYGLNKNNTLDADLEQIDEEINSQHYKSGNGDSHLKDTIDKQNDGSIFHKDPSQSRFVESVMTNS